VQERKKLLTPCYIDTTIKINFIIDPVLRFSSVRHCTAVTQLFCFDDRGI